MLDFIFQKGAAKSTQKLIDKQNSKVNLHVPEDLPLPSIRELKKIVVIVGKINDLEEKMKGLTDEQLQAYTQDFRDRLAKAVEKDLADYDRAREEYNTCTENELKEDLNIQVDRAKEVYLKTKQQAISDILPEAFAVAREASVRVLGMRHYDVQMVGGIVLNGGNIAEMTTGEG